MEIPARRSNNFPEKQTGLSASTSAELSPDTDNSESSSESAFGQDVYDRVSYKSWAQQTEESYQLQLALALRLSLEASRADDANFLEPGTDDRSTRSGSDLAEVLSHRFWVNGCMSYYDKVPDGFYLIHGVDPYIWTISTDLQETGRVPSFDSLKAVDPLDGLPIEVILIDKSRDPGLKELQNRVLSLSSSWITGQEMVDHLAELVCNHMGGVASGEDCFADGWKKCTGLLKGCFGSVVLPMGSLSVGFCVHRALLFKLLADMVNLPCRIAKGCKYCGRDFASSCLVRFGNDREYIVDLIGRPGSLSQPDSFLNGTSSIVVSSPLCHPRFRAAESAENLRMLARLYFSDCQSLNITFDDVSSGTSISQDNTDPQVTKPHEMKNFDRNNPISNSSNDHELSVSPLPGRAGWTITHDRDFQMQNSFNPFLNVLSSTHLAKGPVLPSQILRNGYREAQPTLAFSDLRPETDNNVRFMESNYLATREPPSHGHDFSLDEEDLDIQWSDLVLKEKIGSGSFGTVHLAELRGSDVAVKILMEQDFYAERVKEFRREFAMMKRLRHPNIVLFMGAVTQPPNLSIVTEYLSRGSLYKLLGMRDAGVILDDRRRLNMAYDVAKGMNYLHQLKPPIVHRDLKSPNLLVDSKYTVKVCDFGLSRTKLNTFLSSKTAAGTPEWMAPEVLRDEPSNEKSDVYSFGVILWELVTLQQPWRNFTPLQVVASVGFKGQRLEIPSNVNPQVTALIEACWADEMGAKAKKAMMKKLKKGSSQKDESADFLPLEGGPGHKLPKSETTENKATVLYIGRIPHGFYENEMEGFFKQFGTIKKLRLAKNKKTGKSKHFGFIEFESPEVAKIVSECMHNYLMFEHMLQVYLIPPERVHPKLWKGPSRWHKPVDWVQIERKRHNKERTLEEHKKLVGEILKRDQKKRKKIEAAGIDYECPEIVGSNQPASKKIRFEED
ncbi:hypothetical protein CsSME_00000462 [Camellia sinensis var. sinensis]